MSEYLNKLNYNHIVGDFMKIKMQRVFYPVGQGGFYSESFSTENSKFNVVYDCGSVSKGIDKVISNSFDKNEDIDILFISHFDNDHVNKIKILKNRVRKIKNVVMPLLSDENKCILLALYESLGKDYESSIEIISNPSVFFGDDTKIIHIKEVNEDTNMDSTQSIVNINEVTSDILDSGENITFPINGKEFWVYKPYNYVHKQRYGQLIIKLQSKGLSIKDLNNIDYVNTNIKLIRECYKKISGNINQNSLVLYSNGIKDKLYNCSLNYIGKDFSFNLWRYDCFLCYCVLNNEFKIGCIYTGDVDLKAIRNNFIKQIKSFSNHLPINTIQVPHHGSKNGFDIDFFKDFDKGTCKIISPISFGLYNSYGHPSSMVIKQLTSECHFPIYVTNDKRDLFTQVFEFEV